MFARCARVAPAMAFIPSSAVFASTERCLSCCTTLMPLLRASVSVPLAPFTVTVSAPIVALTPCGRSTGFFATRDISILPLSGDRLLDYEQHFAAGAGRARLAIGHDALRGRDHRDTQAAQHLRQFVLAAIDTQSRAADALDAIDHGPAVVILEL